MKTPKMEFRLVPAVLAAAAAFCGSAFADTHNVAAGATVPLAGVTETSATVKTGAGTLDLSGANSLKRLQVAEGFLHISGGSTTITDSTATGTDAGNQVFESLPAASGILIDGGATVSLKSGAYANVKGGTLTIANATLDATGLANDFMIAHRWVGDGGSMVVIGDGGVLKANNLRPASSGTLNKPAFKENTGIRLDQGGELHLKRFYLDQDAKCYGRIMFNGGVLYPLTAGASLFTVDSTTHSSTAWDAGYVAPTVLAGGCYIHDDVGTIVYQSLYSGVGTGEKDGGVHFSGTADVTWHAKGSTFNGGTYLGSASHLLKFNEADGDSVFGAVPESPEPNIFAIAQNTVLYCQSGTATIHPNRNVSIANGIKFRTSAAANARLVIGGEINGEHAANETWSTNTILEAYSGWAGTTVIGPGEGRTNDIGQLVVSGLLEVTNGVTVVASARAASGTANAVLHVYGNSSGTDFSATRGKLAVTGGTLYAPQSGPRYVYLTQYGQADVCGGTVYMPNVEWLNAQNSPARTTIRDGGVLDVGTFRVAQNVKGNPTVVHLATNGILRARQIVIDTDQAAPPAVTFLFDGGAVQSAIGANDTTGTIEATRGTNDFIRFPANPKWDGVTFAIGPGGAVFDTDNNQHLYWRRPLVKAQAGEPDGGITVRGTKNKSVIFYDDLDYNGPTTVDGDCTLQLRAGSLPTGTRLVLKNGGKAGFTVYDSAHTPTAATLDSIEGDGKLTWCRGVTVTSAIAPSIGGTLTLHEACALNGTTLTIAGDSTGCGKLAFEAVQDISGITLSMADPSAFDKNADANLYKIVDNGNYSGQFRLAADWPNDWIVAYKDTGVYLKFIKPFMMIVR